MSGINKVILVGHLGKDPELRHLDNGIAVVSFPLATSEYFNKDGKRTEQTEWHNIVMWRGLADNASKLLHKGKLIYVEGKLRTRNYEDRERTRRYVTEIVAESFQILGRKSDFEPAQSNGTANTQPVIEDSIGLIAHNKPITDEFTQQQPKGENYADEMPF